MHLASCLIVNPKKPVAISSCAGTCCSPRGIQPSPQHSHTTYNFNIETSLDFNYVRPCLVLLQFNFNFMTRVFCNLNIDISSMIF